MTQDPVSAERALSATLRREVDALRSSGAHEVPPLIIDLMAQAAIALEENAAVATTKEGATPIQSLVDEVTGICNCAEAYSSRGRKDPLCCPCNCGEAIKAAIERAVSERITPSATAVTDTARIDWLEGRVQGRRWEYSPMTAGIASTGGGGYATVREAIDAAMNAVGSNGKDHRG